MSDGKRPRLREVIACGAQELRSVVALTLIALAMRLHPDAVRDVVLMTINSMFKDKTNG